MFPLSNWTELDIWQYIRLENIPIVPLYFAKERPVVNIDGNLIMADDDRLPEEYRDRIEMKEVRFRTLGCWPLTGAVESDADTIEKIVEEMMTTTKVSVPPVSLISIRMPVWSRRNVRDIFKWISRNLK